MTDGLCKLRGSLLRMCSLRLSEIDDRPILIQFNDDHCPFFDRLGFDFHPIEREHLLAFRGPEVDLLLG